MSVAQIMETDENGRYNESSTTEDQDDLDFLLPNSEWKTDAGTED